MQNKPVQLTTTAFEALKKELKELNEVKRPALVERLGRAMTEGDLSENSDYQSAKEELEFLDGRITELTEVVENSKIVDGNPGAIKGKVGVGTQVTIKLNGKPQMFTIVGEWEADPANKKISPSSPLGQVLMDKAKGDKVTVDAPAGKVIYEILEVK
jgi:transcription elongation factor GreA